MAKRNVGHTTIENLAAQVGMFFGTTEAHTRRWLGQREELIKALSAVQSRAGALIKELGGGSFRWTKSKSRRRAKSGIPVVQGNERRTRKKRVRRLSAAARAKISVAQKRRWAAAKKSAE